MISFEQMDIKDVDWGKMADVGEINIFQTLPWLNFISTAHNSEPVVVSVKSDDRICGYFLGLLTKKFGLRILGSPFRGWVTYFMGFNLMPDISRKEVLEAFPPFVFNQLKCHYLEIVDPNLKDGAIMRPHYRVDHLPWFALDLVPSEEGLFANMKDTGRRGVRKAQKSGVIVEEASDINFADEFFDQYLEVMAKRSLKPTFKVEYVRQLIEAMLPTGSLLLLRARSPEGVSIATALFLSLNKTAIYWGGASLQQYQSLHPNELIIWQAMKTVKKRGASIFHLGGEAEQFKLKFGSVDAQIFRLRKAFHPLLDQLLNLATISANPRYRNWFLRKI